MSNNNYNNGVTPYDNNELIIDRFDSMYEFYKRLMEKLKEGISCDNDNTHFRESKLQ